MLIQTVFTKLMELYHLVMNPKVSHQFPEFLHDLMQTFRLISPLDDNGTELVDLANRNISFVPLNTIGSPLKPNPTRMVKSMLNWPQDSIK